jgi:glutamyl-tRNA reductase
MEATGINQLLVLHRPKDAAGHGMPAVQQAQLTKHCFFLDTCLRQLAIVDMARAPAFIRSQEYTGDPKIEWHLGTNAYSFLLQTATGLNSSIPGETNILGQFKQAWNLWREQANPEQVSQLHTTMQRLFSDSAQIHREYLQGIGGNSYGSLARKILAPASDSRLLFVGAGKLARSMLPLFSTFELATWNHQPLKNQSLKNQSMKNHVDQSGKLFSALSAQEAADWATHIVLTTPPEARNDQLWAQLTATDTQPVVHLGRRRAEPGIWASRANYFDLDDIFALRDHQSSLRISQIQRARRACAQLALTSHDASTAYLPQSAVA